MSSPLNVEYHQYSWSSGDGGLTRASTLVVVLPVSWQDCGSAFSSRLEVSVVVGGTSHVFREFNMVT